MSVPRTSELSSSPMDDNEAPWRCQRYGSGATMILCSGGAGGGANGAITIAGGSSPRVVSVKSASTGRLRSAMQCRRLAFVHNSLRNITRLVPGPHLCNVLSIHVLKHILCCQSSEIGSCTSGCGAVHIALVLSRLTESHHLNLSHLWQRCEESLSGHTEALFAAKVEGSSEDRDGFLVKISHPQVRWHRANRKCTPGQRQRGLGEAGKERARAIGI